MKIYLAGPISGCDWSGAMGWRKQAELLLEQHGLVGYSPLRLKDFLAGSNDLSYNNVDHTHPLTTSRGIMTRDFNDCITASALLVNFTGVSKLSAGTAMEMAWAYDRHIPVVVVCEEDNPHLQHPMIREAIDFHVTTLEAGVELVRTIILSD